MNKFFSNKKLIIIMILIIFTFGMIAVSVNIRDKKETPPFFQQSGNDALGVVGRVVFSPVNALRNFNSNVNDLFNTYSENKKLKSKLQDYQQNEASLDIVRKENKDLKKQLKLYNTLTDFNRINASVLSRSPSDWQNYLIINRGSTSNIKKNMPVMSGSGLIGRIAEVNKTNSKVELISSENSLSNRFAAEIVTDGKDINGIISSYDNEHKVLIMNQVSNVKEIKPGQKVITSGLGGITPRGLYIGEVISVKKDEYGLSNEVYLKPATNLSNFTVVTVIDRSLGEK